MNIENLDKKFKQWLKNKKKDARRVNSDLKEELEYLHQKRIEREMRGNRPIGYRSLYDDIQ